MPLPSLKYKSSPAGGGKPLFAEGGWTRWRAPTPSLVRPAQATLLPGAKTEPARRHRHYLRTFVGEFRGGGSGPPLPRGIAEAARPGEHANVCHSSPVAEAHATAIRHRRDIPGRGNRAWPGARAN